VYKEIKHCIICSGNLSEVLSLGEQYVVDFVKEKDENLLKAPLTLMRCNWCSLIQLKHRVEPDRLYKKFWYRSGINEQMKTELQKIVENACATVELNQGDKVLDIGCNDGTLLGMYPKGITTFGVDPCGSLVEEGMTAGRIDIGVPDYFSRSAIGQPLGITPKFKIITAIAMFYDLENPIEFLKDCKALLHDEGVLIIQMNYLMKMLTDTAFDNICHEHLGYYSVSTLDEAVKRAGLELQGVEESSCNGGSLRAYITQKGFDKFSIRHSQNKLWLFTKMQRMQIDEMRSGLNTEVPYKQFSMDIAKKVLAVSKMLSEQYHTESKVYLYGASTRGTVLTQTLFQNETSWQIQGVAERDENKYGLKMVGTWIPIVPEEEFRLHATHALILPWHFESSIVRREKDWIDKGGKFIVPLPKPKVVEVNRNAELSLTSTLL
jgi:hypothetical protein